MRTKSEVGRVDRVRGGENTGITGIIRFCRSLTLLLILFTFLTQCSRGYPDSDWLASLLMLDTSGSTTTSGAVTGGAGVTVTPGGIFTSESGSADTFTVVLDKAPTADVIFNISSSAPTVGSVSPASLTFTPGNWNGTQTVTVTGQDDSPSASGNTIYSITIGAAVSSDPDYNNMGPYSVSALNLDNEVILGTPGILVLPTSGLYTSEGGGSAAFSMVLQSQPSADVTVDISSSLTTEGQLSADPLTLTFTSGNWDSPQSVTVTGQDDSIVDGDIAFQITTAAAASLDTNYSGIDPADVNLTNLDNDTPGITVTASAPLVISEPATSNNFTVVLDSEPTALVKICLSDSDPTEGAISTTVGDALGADVNCPTARLEFTAANWNVAQTVQVDAVDDPNADGTQDHTVILGAAISSDPKYNGIDPNDVSFRTTDNDGAAGITVTGGALTGISETGGFDTFTVVLNTEPSADVIVNVQSSDSGEAAIDKPSLTFTTGGCPGTGNWCTVQTVTVTGVDDQMVDGAQPFTIQLATSSGDPVYNAIDPPDPTGSNADNDTFGITVSPISGLTTSEGGQQAFFVIALNTQPVDNVIITLTSTDTNEGIVSPADFTFTPANWSAPQTATVTGQDDGVNDGDTAYGITTGADITTTDPDYNGLNPADVTLTNLDNDTAAISVSAASNPLLLSETGSSNSFTVVLGSEPAGLVKICLTESDPSEAAISTVIGDAVVADNIDCPIATWTAQLEFTNLNWNLPQTVSVDSVDDPNADGNQFHTIILSAAISADPSYSGMDPADVNFETTDNETAGITVTGGAPLLGISEAGGSDTFTVVLNSEPTADVIVNVNSSDTTEAAVTPIAMTFTTGACPATGNWCTAQTATVVGVDDSDLDGAQPFSILLTTLSADPVYDLLDPVDPIGSTADNDTAGITVTPTSGLYTSEGGVTASFVVVLDTRPSADVTIGLASNDTGEGTITVTDLTFTPANWNVPRTVVVTGQDDGLDDGNVAYSITTTADTTTTDIAYNGLDPADVNIINLDNDTFGIKVTAASVPLLLSEPASSNNFTVVLESQPTALVKICLSETDATEGAISTTVGDALGPDIDCPTARLEFTAANWNIVQTVQVDTVDDPNADGNKLHGVLLAPAISADPNYSGLDTQDVPFLTTDDETAGITVNPNPLVLNESGTSDTIDIVLNTDPTADVVVNAISDDASEAIAAPSSLTFTPGPCPATGNWCTPQTVTVVGQDDLIADGIQTFTIIIAASSADPIYDSIDPADAGGATADNDMVGVAVNPTTNLETGERGKKDTFTVSLNTQPAADVIITADATLDAAEIRVSNDDTVYGNTADLTFTPANWFLGQTVYVQGVNDGVLDGDQPFTIGLTAVSGDTGYDAIPISSVTGTNLYMRFHVFVTSQRYDGNLGGIAGADNKCDIDPYNPNPTPGAYKALIVDDVIRRACSSQNCTVGGLTEHINWVLKPNMSYVRLFDRAPIMNTDANGVFVFNPATLSNAWDVRSVGAWTGICDDPVCAGAQGWSTDPPAPDWTCNGWTSNMADPPGLYHGDGTVTSDLTQMWGGTASCDSLLYLICVEQ